MPGRVLHLLTNPRPHHQWLRPAFPLHHGGPAGSGLGRARRHPARLSGASGEAPGPATDVVDGVRYRRLLPSRLAATMDARLQQQAEELLEVALEFRPSVLHTTTHFVNGLVVRAVAEALGIPWVYEVRGQLADTWAATRGDRPRQRKLPAFQAREADVMRAADLVVTLGRAMKANIVAAGIPADKIVIAPNAVGGAFLRNRGQQGARQGTWPAG